MFASLVRTGFALLSLQSLLGPLLDHHSKESKRFVLTDTYIGSDFLNSWTWMTFDDPTHGRVDYIDQKTALALNLTYVSHDKLIMRADSDTIVVPDARGRKSIRIHSDTAYDEAIAILDLQHMPEGCATWPAFWSYSQKGPWPTGGELDIMEGVNLDERNMVSLHTLPDCTISGGRRRQRLMNGNATSLNCDTSVNFNQGCGVVMKKPASYGSDFNSAGGGYFVVVRTKHAHHGPEIRVWFWTRFDPALPPEVKNPPMNHSKDRKPTIYPTKAWGLPEAYFPLGKKCNYEEHFDPHMFVFDLTFCGDWAGTVYPNSGCPGECTGYVDNHPEAFTKAYWEVNSFYVYTPDHAH